MIVNGGYVCKELNIDLCLDKSLFNYTYYLKIFYRYIDNTIWWCLFVLSIIDWKLCLISKINFLSKYRMPIYLKCQTQAVTSVDSGRSF